MTMTEEELKVIGLEVVDLFKNRSFEKICSTYGYALKMASSAEEAIEQDFDVAITECGGNIEQSKITVAVSHFEPNETGLKSLVECNFHLGVSVGVLVELIQTDSGSIYLEQVSSYGGTSNA